GLKALLAADISVQLENSDSLKTITPLLAELLDYRRALVVNYAEFLAREVRQASNGRVRCFLQCFPPPFNLLSGFDIAAIDPLVSDIGVKLYTMHWPMIERAYVERLIAFAGGDADHRLRQVRSLLRTAHAEQGAFSEVAYPRPDEPHPAPDDIIEEKLRTAAASISNARMWGLTHSYGPVGDVVRRFRAVHRAACGRVHINRYGYL
ncbi:MAG: hypothetical protein GY788_23565, partial [bacterium]|nr:hypothetical protein [bacterium]